MCTGSPREGTNAKAAGCQSRACPRLTCQDKSPKDRSTASWELGGDPHTQECQEHPNTPLASCPRKTLGKTDL